MQHGLVNLCSVVEVICLYIAWNGARATAYCLAGRRCISHAYVSRLRQAVDSIVHINHGQILVNQHPSCPLECLSVACAGRALRRRSEA